MLEYLSEFSLEREMFQTKFIEIIKTFMPNSLFFGNRGIIRKNTLRAGETADDNMMLRRNDTICVVDKQAQIQTTLTILILTAFPRLLSL
jgi:hypothetical protein